MKLKIQIAIFSILMAFWAFPATAQVLEQQICRNKAELNVKVLACSSIATNEKFPAEIRAEAYLYRGIAYHEANDYIKAVSDFDEAIRLDKNLALAYVFRADVFNNEANYAQAIDNINFALSINSKSHSAYYVRGITYLLQKENEKAKQDFTKAASLAPTYFENYLRRGAIYFSEGKWNEALNDANKAVSLLQANSTDRTALPEALQIRAKSYEQLGLLNEAISDYRTALSLDNNLGEVRTALERLGFPMKFAFLEESELRNIVNSMKMSASNRLRAGQNQGAIDEYSAAIKIMPTEWELYFYRGRVYAMKGNNFEADQDFTSALVYSGSQNAWNAYLHRAYVRLKKNQIEGAFSDSNMALAKAGFYDKYSIYYVRALIFEAMGDINAARVEAGKCNTFIASVALLNFPERSCIDLVARLGNIPTKRSQSIGVRQ